MKINPNRVKSPVHRAAQSKRLRNSRGRGVMSSVTVAAAAAAAVSPALATAATTDGVAAAFVPSAPGIADRTSVSPLQFSPTKRTSSKYFAKKYRMI